MIRRYLDEKGLPAPEPRELWPREEEAHCAWALSFLEKLPPRLERRELEERLEQLRAPGS